MKHQDATLRSNPLDETALIERARIGDEGAIRALVQRNNRRLYRIVRAVLGNDMDAEDAVQDAYLRAFTHLDTFRGEAAFDTWLTRIALNEAFQRLRRPGRTVSLPDGALGSPRDVGGGEIIAFPGPPAATDPEREAARRQLREVLEAAVDCLPPWLRVVFVLRDVEELSTAETAAQLGVKEATVKTRLHRARRLLRSSLDTDIATALTGAFPFAGARCARMAEQVAERLRG